MSVQVNGHGVSAVTALAVLWWLLISDGGMPQPVIAYYAAVSVLYALLIIANVDNQIGRGDPEDRQDMSFRRMRVAWGAHLFLFLAVAALRTDLLPRLGFIWTFVIALLAGLSVPFMLVRRVAANPPSSKPRTA